MAMYVELPARRQGRTRTPVPSGAVPAAVEAATQPLASTTISGPPTGATTSALELKPSPSAGPPLARPPESDILSPGGPKFAIVLPQKKTPSHRTEKQARNYVIVELEARQQASFGARMRAILGDHADWSEMIMNGVKPSQSRSGIIVVMLGF